ncbi:DUF4326 domain-containing protein [[Actinomadura] parvosata]|uniref:DUF4326 domain-containing protein n=1 Tax=[Actinomadura] parvosata TaxID=1955412 RepID=UPI00406D01C4
MPETKRVQVTGDLFHPQLPHGAIWCGRQGPHLKRSPWANPHTLSGAGCWQPGCDGRVHRRQEVLDLYREHLVSHPELVERARAELDGQALACRCKLDEACHVDVLLAAMAARE